MARIARIGPSEEVFQSDLEIGTDSTPDSEHSKSGKRIRHKEDEARARLATSTWELDKTTFVFFFGEKAYDSRRFLLYLNQLSKKEASFRAAQHLIEEARQARQSGILRRAGVSTTKTFVPQDILDALKAKDKEIETLANANVRMPPRPPRPSRKRLQPYRDISKDSNQPGAEGEHVNKRRVLGTTSRTLKPITKHNTVDHSGQLSHQRRLHDNSIGESQGVLTRKRARDTSLASVVIRGNNVGLAKADSHNVDSPEQDNAEEDNEDEDDLDGSEYLEKEMHLSDDETALNNDTSPIEDTNNRTLTNTNSFVSRSDKLASHLRHPPGTYVSVSTSTSDIDTSASTSTYTSTSHTSISESISSTGINNSTTNHGPHDSLFNLDCNNCMSATDIDLESYLSLQRASISQIIKAVESKHHECTTRLAILTAARNTHAAAAATTKETISRGIDSLSAASDMLKPLKEYAEKCPFPDEARISTLESIQTMFERDEAQLARKKEELKTILMAVEDAERDIRAVEEEKGRAADKLETWRKWVADGCCFGRVDVENK